MVIFYLKQMPFSVLLRSVEGEKGLQAIFANAVTGFWPAFLHGLTALGYRFFHSIRKQKGIVYLLPSFS